MVTLSPMGPRAVAVRGNSPAGSRRRPGEVLVLPGRGLQLPEHLSFETWLGVGRRLADIHGSSAWCLGDWLIYGEASYRGRYREAIDRTSLDYQTLRNYAWVAKRFRLSRRWDRLSFGHHAEVAALPEAEQDFWLRKAHESSWSVRQLRHEVRASHNERSAAPSEKTGVSGESQDGQPTPAGGSMVEVELHVSPVRLAAYQAAAHKVGLALEEWGVLVLDKAADVRQIAELR